MADDTVNKSEIIALYQKTAQEITRYRDMEWKVTIWSLSLLAGIISLSKLIPISADHRAIIQIIFVTFIFVAIPFSIWHIHHCHNNLTKNRRVHRKCEQELHLDSFLPSEWKKEPKKIRYTQGLLHLISWVILIILTASFTIYSVFLWSTD